MYVFKRDVTSLSASRTFRAGSPVPDGFTSPAGLAEMLKSGDVVFVEDVVKKVEKVIVPEAVGAPKPADDVLEPKQPEVPFKKKGKSGKDSHAAEAEVAKDL